MKFKEILTYAIASLIATVWVIAFFLAYKSKDWTALKYVTPLMVAVSTYLFGFGITRRNGHSNGKAKSD